MAEYIDREQLLELINEDCKYQNPTNEYTRGCNEVCDWAIKTIKNIPTADVVPKSEVEELTREKESLAKTVNEASELIRKLRSKIDELKKYRYQVLPDGRIELLPRTDIEKIKTDVAREIFAEIDNFLIKTVGEFDKALDKAIREDKYGLASVYSDEKNLVITLKIAIAELKKKYTEEQS